ncbi:MAG: hypothetical protein ACQEQS_05440 [Thermodesulfobacteriota bacterium]
MENKNLTKMTLLDIMAEYENSEEIIKSYDKKAGTCLCCNHLFETLEDVCKKFSLSEEEIISRITT